MSSLRWSLIFKKTAHARSFLWQVEWLVSLFMRPRLRGQLCADRVSVVHTLPWSSVNSVPVISLASVVSSLPVFSVLFVLGLYCTVWLTRSFLQYVWSTRNLLYITFAWPYSSWFYLGNLTFRFTTLWINCWISNLKLSESFLWTYNGVSRHNRWCIASKQLLNICVYSEQYFDNFICLCSALLH